MNSTTLGTQPISSTRLNRIEVLSWCALAAVVVLSHLYVTHGTLLSNDGYQYLSTARNFLSGHPAYTSIVHFDSERSFGLVPAPLTTFPSGFPLLIAAVGTTGISLETSALIVSVSAFVLLVPLFFYASRALSINLNVARALVLLLIGNSWAAIYGTAATAESLFTLASFAALALFMNGLCESESESRRLRVLLLAGLLVGLSYWIRYAGLFLLAATALFCIAQLSLRRDAIARNTFLPLALALIIVTAGLLRNQLLVGSWKGGNTKAAHHPLEIVLRESAVWLHHLFLGGIASAQIGISEILLLVGMFLVAGSLLPAPLRGSRDLAPQSRRPLRAFSFLACYIAVYFAGMIYLGVTSVISFDTRMFYPILPCILLLLGLPLSVGRARIVPSPRRRTAFAAGLLVSIAAYCSINSRSYTHPLPEPPHAIAARELSGTVERGLTMRSWIESHIPTTQTIVANRGQATGYLLKRNTVSLVSSEYSDQQWNETSVRSLMRTYASHFLILYAGDGGDAVLHESAFLSSLARGQIPAWLTVAARNRDVTVFRSVEQ